MVLIQKSKLEVVDMQVMREISGFERTRWSFLLSVGAIGGVIIFWDKDWISEVASRVDNFSVILMASRVGETTKWFVTAECMAQWMGLFFLCSLMSWTRLGTTACCLGAWGGFQ